MSWKRCGCNASHDSSGAKQSPFLDLIFGLLLYQDKSDRQLKGLKSPIA
ncbi:MAG: hypothetical protein IPQ04_08255 [Saprospiraceae bacterium]|nr:hypothetical protein [Saprospiraceae bacterium]